MFRPIVQVTWECVIRATIHHSQNIVTKNLWIQNNIETTKNSKCWALQYLFVSGERTFLITLQRMIKEWSGKCGCLSCCPPCFNLKKSLLHYFWLAVHDKPVLFWKGTSGLKFPCFLFMHANGTGPFEFRAVPIL